MAVEQFVVGVQSGEFGTVVGRLPISGRAYDQTDQFLARPFGIVDEVMGQPVHQFGMSGRRAPDAEILRRSDETVTEQVSPDLIDGYPRGDGVGGIDQPSGKIEPVDRPFRVSWLEGMKQAETAFSNFMDGLLEFSTTKDVRLARAAFSLSNYSDVGGRWLGGFFTKVVQLFADLGRHGVRLGEMFGQQLALVILALGRLHQKRLTNVFGGDVGGMFPRYGHDAKPSDDVPGAV